MPLSSARFRASGAVVALTEPGLVSDYVRDAQGPVGLPPARAPGAGLRRRGPPGFDLLERLRAPGHGPRRRRLRGDPEQGQSRRAGLRSRRCSRSGLQSTSIGFSCSSGGISRAKRSSGPLDTNATPPLFGVAWRMTQARTMGPLKITSQVPLALRRAASRWMSSAGR